MESLKQRVQNALYQRNGFRYQHPSWNPKLWGKSKEDIKGFLLKRFHETLDIEEYYATIVLLYHQISNKEILIEFKNSPQYQRMNHTMLNSTITRSEYDLPELNRTHQNSIEIDIIKPDIEDITIIGDE